MSTVNKLLIGVTVGAILGVLYAPDKGSVTRRKLSRAGNNIRDSFYDFRDAINEKIDSLRDDSDDLAYNQLVMNEDEISAESDAWQAQ